MRLTELLRIVYATLYQLLLLVSIPLAFDVGGENCGISFTLMLSIWYGMVSTVRSVFHGTRIRALGSSLYYLSVLVLPSLLLLHLNYHPQVEKMPLYNRLVHPWELFIGYATGPFAILEGFCTLLSIQMLSRASRSLARQSDAFLIIQTILASLLTTLDFVCLVRIYAMPDVLGLLTATLIGVAITACLSLSVYGILTKKSNVMETSLLFSYVVYVIYLTFTDFQSDDSSTLFPFFSGTPTVSSAAASAAAAAAARSPTNAALNSMLSMIGLSAPKPSSPAAIKQHLFDQNLPPLPPVLIDSYTSFMTTVAELTPTAVRTLTQFVAAMVTTITPSVMVSLVVRLSVFFFAMRVVPYIYQPRSPSPSLPQSPSTTSPPLPPQKRRSRWRQNPGLFLIYSYSPCFVIAVYTHLLMQHFGRIVHIPKTVGAAPVSVAFSASKIWYNSRLSWQFWGWVNVFTTLTLYGLELMNGNNDFQ